MRLILIPDNLHKAKGPIGVGKRGGKIYGYDDKGKPIYKPSDVPDKPKHRGQSGYAERREAKLERVAQRAQKMLEESKSRYAAVRHTLDTIPPGQPILVGHHSEARHRRDLERMDRNMRASIEAGKKAERLQAAADNPSSAISSDDPKAVQRLKKKLGQLEELRTEYKALNTAYRRVKGDWSKIQDVPGWTPKQLSEARTSQERFNDKQPVPGYRLSNLGAQIRDVKKRIENLAKEAATPAMAPIEGAGWSIREDTDDNRIWVEFDKKPPRSVTQNMRAQGFKWSPTRSAWIRQLNNAGRYAAQQVASTLSETTLPGAVSPTTNEPVETERETQRKREARHTDTVNSAQQAYAVKMNEARKTMDAATGLDLSTDKRSKQWTQAAAQIQEAVGLVRDRNAALGEVRALRGETPDAAQQKREVRELQELEADAAKARAKAANPDANLELPFFGGRTEERIRTQMLKEIREREEQEARRAREIRPLEKKPAKKGKMAAREKAGQKLLLSRTAQLHLDNRF